MNALKQVIWDASETVLQIVLEKGWGFLNSVLIAWGTEQLVHMTIAIGRFVGCLEKIVTNVKNALKKNVDLISSNVQVFPFQRL